MAVKTVKIQNLPVAIKTINRHGRIPQHTSTAGPLPRKLPLNISHSNRITQLQRIVGNHSMQHLLRSRLQISASSCRPNTFEQDVKNQALPSCTADINPGNKSQRAGNPTGHFAQWHPANTVQSNKFTPLLSIAAQAQTRPAGTRVKTAYESIQSKLPTKALKNALSVFYHMPYDSAAYQKAIERWPKHWPIWSVLREQKAKENFIRYIALKKDNTFAGTCGYRARQALEAYSQHAANLSLEDRLGWAKTEADVLPSPQMVSHKDKRFSRIPMTVALVFNHAFNAVLTGNDETNFNSYFFLDFTRNKSLRVYSPAKIESLKKLLEIQIKHYGYLQLGLPQYVPDRRDPRRAKGLYKEVTFRGFFLKPGRRRRLFHRAADDKTMSDYKVLAEKIFVAENFTRWQAVIHQKFCRGGSRTKPISQEQYKIYKQNPAMRKRWLKLYLDCLRFTKKSRLKGKVVALYKEFIVGREFRYIPNIGKHYPEDSLRKVKP